MGIAIETAMGCCPQWVLAGTALEISLRTALRHVQKVAARADAETAAGTQPMHGAEPQLQQLHGEPTGRSHAFNRALRRQAPW